MLYRITSIRDKYNVPIYCGGTGENKDEWVKTFKTCWRKNNNGWHYWPYKAGYTLALFIF